jgi:hypothetical protein
MWRVRAVPVLWRWQGIEESTWERSHGVGLPAAALRTETEPLRLSSDLGVTVWFDLPGGARRFSHRVGSIDWPQS